MAYDEVSQLRGTTAQIANYKGYPAQLVQNTETGKMGVMQGDTAGNIKYLANEEQLTPLATKEELKPLAKDAEVLKLIAQNLTPEQKAQILKNLEDTFLPLDLSKGLVGNHIYRSTDSDFLVLCGGVITSNDSYVNILGSKNPDNPDTIELMPGGYSKGGGLVCGADGTIKWRTHQVDYVEAKGPSWIRFASGIQICWELTSHAGTNHAVINFPVPFSQYPATFIDGGNGAHSIDWDTTKITITTGAPELGYFIWCSIGWWK